MHHGIDLAAEMLNSNLPLEHINNEPKQGEAMTLNFKETRKQGPMIHKFAGSTSAKLRFQLVCGLAVVSLLVTALPQPAYSHQVALIKIDVAAVVEGHRISRTMGINVKNDDGETIGEINDFIR